MITPTERDRIVARYLFDTRYRRDPPYDDEIVKATGLGRVAVGLALGRLVDAGRVRFIGPNRRHTVIRYRLTRAGRTWLGPS